MKDEDEEEEGKWSDKWSDGWCGSVGRPGSTPVS